MEDGETTALQNDRILAKLTLESRLKQRTMASMLPDPDGGGQGSGRLLDSEIKNLVLLLEATCIFCSCDDSGTSDG